MLFECPLDFLSTEELSALKNTFELASGPDDTDAIVTNPGSEYMYDREKLSKFPAVKHLFTPSSGVSHIDTEYCKQAGIRVHCLLNNRDAMDSIFASSEFTWLHIMSAVRKFIPAIEAVRNGCWRDAESDLRSNELAGHRIGIIGMGRIGKNLVRYAKAFRMEVLYYDPYVEIQPGADRVTDILDLARQCDIISINCYLTDETRGMISDEFFRACRTGTVVVNTSRGEVVDEKAVVEAVSSGHIRFSTDVVQNEQSLNKFFGSELDSLSHRGLVYITPHVAGATVESQKKGLWGILAVANRIIQEEKGNV